MLISARYEIIRRVAALKGERAAEKLALKWKNLRKNGMDIVFSLGERFKARHVPARAVEDIGFATHGWCLAKVVAA